MTTVWVCESGEYEQRGVIFVATSLEAGVAYLKNELYKAPYIVTWGELTEEVGFWYIFGRFEFVQDYSTTHAEHFDFMEYEVIEGEKVP